MRAPTLGPLPETLSLPASSSWQHTALCVHRLPEGHRTFTSWLKAKMRLSPWMPPNKHTPQAVRDANVSGAITTHSACIGWQEGSTKEGACHACTAPFGRNSRHPHCTLYGPCIVLCFLKPCPVAQAKGHCLNCLSVPEAVLLLLSRNFVRGVFQPRSTDWHKSYYTENLCSRHLKCGQSSEKQLCWQNEHCRKAHFAQAPKVFFFLNKEKGKNSWSN